MLGIGEIRKYIAGLGVAEDSHVYIGKLDNKQEKSIGVYNRKQDGAAQIPLGGMQNKSYDVKPVSLLVHWNRRVSESEKAAQELYEKLLNVQNLTIGETGIRFLALQTPAPVDVGTDDNGVYEFVIWIDFVYER